MVSAYTKFLIPFHPLPMQIAQCLNFPELVYQFLDISKTNSTVVVKTDCGPIAYIYVGGPADKVAESCEKAAQKTMRDLMRKYKVTVEDVTSLKRQIFARCGGLFSLKRTEFQRMEQGEPKAALPEELAEVFAASVKQVPVDFISILRAVFRKITVRSTPIEIFEHSPSQFTAWFTVTPPSSPFDYECIFSDQCSTLAAAKQNLAKKVVHYLMAVYSFEVVDANYNPSDSRFGFVLCTLERESYLTLKERVLGIQELLEPSLLLVEQDCITPRASAYRIPSILSVPLPPKKPKAYLAISGPSFIAASKTKLPVFFSVPSELDFVFKRQKNA
ncbi:uncharacterized protein [Spinacia oleracea]|uniref:DRBM domain-containing protein n=1 Tax=Spinacia oleracea TaxID=3562 RepID=A0ABM3REM3_SPIOL|nr:uncharacterized protein LOC130469095 [Spinacia oleracea]